MSTTSVDQSTPERTPGQLRAFVRVVHPRQAVVIAVVVGTLASLMGRPVREVLASAGAVLITQLLLGLVNDICDVDVDRRSGVIGKPLATGAIPLGNATFAVALLLLLAIPLSLQNGTAAGLALLGTLVVGLLHNRWLHTTWFSWVGWSATFVLLTWFVSFGGWGHETVGSAPVTSFAVLAGALGFLVHFSTSLPDLVADNESGARNLPLRVALRTGAPRLLVLTTTATVLVVAALVYTALTAGIAH